MPEQVKAYFAPNCRRGPHSHVEHHERFAKVVKRSCDCPCHCGGGQENGPWWSDVNAPKNASSMAHGQR